MMEDGNRSEIGWRILVLIKGALESAVPIVSTARQLASMGNQVEIVCSNSEPSLRIILSREGINVTSVNSTPRQQRPTLLRKLQEWLRFRLGAGLKISKIRPDLLYIGSADTALALAGRVANFPYVLHLRELHDQQPIYMRLLGPIARRAWRVVVPEVNRSFIYSSQLRLMRRPAVLPNKPFSHPRQRHMDISFLPKNIQARLKSDKVIIYQGPIHKERSINSLLNALYNIRDYTVVLMGRDYGLIESYRKIFPRLIHIDFISPPLHLNVTSWAHIGLIPYDADTLNTIYCAPNKIWEYSGFGIPMLCSENPGLSYTVEQAGAAELIDLNDQTLIRAALERLEKNYDIMSLRASNYYDSTDTEAILAEILG